MFCKNCGQQIIDGSRFCTNCGAKLTPSTAQSETAIERLQIQNQPKQPRKRKIYTDLNMGLADP